jgi:hypothetical protein
VKTKDKGRNSDLEAILKQAEHYASYMMKGSSGSVPATLMVATPEGFVLHLPTKFASVEDKDNLAKTGRLLTVGFKASAIAMISEAWITIPKRRGQPPDLTTPPSESPDREEVVAIMAECHGRSAQRFLFIQRDSFGKFIGFGTSLLPPIDEVQGRFAGLMPPKEPTNEMAMAARNLLQAMGIAVEKAGFDPRWN